MKRENLDADPSAGECCGKAGALPQAGGPPGAGGGQEQPSPGLQGGAALPEAPSPALASSSDLQGWTRVNASPQSCPVDEAVSPQLRKVPAAALLILTTPAAGFSPGGVRLPKRGRKPFGESCSFLLQKWGLRSWPHLPTLQTWVPSGCAEPDSSKHTPCPWRQAGSSSNCGFVQNSSKKSETRQQLKNY